VGKFQLCSIDSILQGIVLPDPIGIVRYYSNPYSHQWTLLRPKRISNHAHIHASVVNDEIYQMLCRDEDRSINPDYYKYVESYGGVLLLHRKEHKKAIRAGAKKIEWFSNMSPELGEMYGFPYLFNAIFICTPLTISSDYCIPVAGYANFYIYDMKKANLRYGMFSYSKIEYCDFSDTILVSTDFSHAILNHSNFENADMRNSSLLGAEIKGCKFDNCILTGTVLPDGFCSDNQEEQYEHVLQFI
jgi:hypothetical protein